MKLLRTTTLVLLVLIVLVLCAAFIWQRFGEREVGGGADRLDISEVRIQESNADYLYSVDVTYPTFLGGNISATPVVTQAVRLDVERRVREFVTDARQIAQNTPPELLHEGAESVFEARARLEHPTDTLVSITMDGYYSTLGAAHPGHVTWTYLFDLETGEQYTLDELFGETTGYLELISAYARRELYEELGEYANPDFVETGAAPDLENFEVFSVSKEGITFIFNEYQVAPYAAGPQTVEIPFSVLRRAIDPSGPLAPFGKKIRARTVGPVV